MSGTEEVDPYLSGVLEGPPGQTPLCHPEEHPIHCNIADLSHLLSFLFNAPYNQEPIPSHHLGNSPAPLLSASLYKQGPHHLWIGCTLNEGHPKALVAPPELVLDAVQLRRTGVQATLSWPALAFL